MENLQYACLMPHPPIVVPEVGGRETAKCRQTAEGMTRVAEKLVAGRPDTLVVITPHGTVFQDGIAITAVDQLQGNLGAFHAPDVSFSYKNDLSFVNDLQEHCQSQGITTALLDERLARQYQVDTALDHGVMVPLYYIKKAGFKGSLVVVAMGLLPNVELYSFGIALQETIVGGNKRVAVVASGDMSHRLTPDAPAGFNPRGKEFDAAIRQALASGDVWRVVNMPRGLAEEAGECGLRPLIMLLGCLDGYRLQSEVVSYEGPFGVGYLVAELMPEGNKGDSLLAAFKEHLDRVMAETRKNEHEVVRLAREALEGFVRHGKVIEPDYRLSEELPDRAGVFVSLKKHGQLRGCIGTTQPTRDSLAEEVMYNALSAGLRDPRFPPVTAEELDEITYSVDILHPPEKVADKSELDPKEYGVIVRAGNRSGLLLPNLEGIDTVEEQLSIALKKAGIDPDENYEIERFRVDRYY
ncbi:MAG: AmmeMemoRadiSam system protein A [Thermoanaerobacteraceae bacterium]|nr:AmmeMemoRadiSam system protein A [Thermoanaerobacteraceae bacterium]